MATSLEMIVLLGKYDLCVKEHLTACREKSRKLPGSRRGQRLSNHSVIKRTTVDNVTTTIQHTMQATIASEIQEADMFSVQSDTTQDIDNTRSMLCHSQICDERHP